MNSVKQLHDKCDDEMEVNTKRACARVTLDGNDSVISNSFSPKVTSTPFISTPQGKLASVKVGETINGDCSNDDGNSMNRNKGTDMDINIDNIFEYFIVDGRKDINNKNDMIDNDLEFTDEQYAAIVSIFY